jgi:hypothetical protein
VLLGAFAVSALLLAVVGIYGVVSYTSRSGRASSASAWRSAPDASSTLRLVLGRSMLLIGAGTVCGLVASVGVTRVMAGLLYGVSPLDPVVFAGVSLTLAAAGFVASLIPARRATRWIRSSRCACRNRDHTINARSRTRSSVRDSARSALYVGHRRRPNRLGVRRWRTERRVDHGPAKAGHYLTRDDQRRNREPQNKMFRDFSAFCVVRRTAVGVSAGAVPVRLDPVGQRRPRGVHHHRQHRVVAGDARGCR